MLVWDVHPSIPALEKLCSLAVRGFGRLGDSGYELIGQVAPSVFWGVNGGRLPTKGPVKKRQMHVI